MGRKGTANVSRAPTKYWLSCAIASTRTGSLGERIASGGQSVSASSGEATNETRVNAPASAARKSEMPNGNEAEVQSTMRRFSPRIGIGRADPPVRAGPPGPASGRGLNAGDEEADQGVRPTQRHLTCRWPIW